MSVVLPSRFANPLQFQKGAADRHSKNPLYPFASISPAIGRNLEAIKSESQITVSAVPRFRFAAAVCMRIYSDLAFRLYSAPRPPEKLETVVRQVTTAPVFKG